MNIRDAFKICTAPCAPAPPPRTVLAAQDYSQAQVISRRLHGKGVSKQAFAITPKIRQADAFARDKRLFKVHPEPSLRLLNGGSKLSHTKKTWAGLEARLRLLESAGIALPPDLLEASAAGMDDVVDAAAAAWSARRIARGEARSFPAEPVERNRSGRVIAVWG